MSAPVSAVSVGLGLSFDFLGRVNVPVFNLLPVITNTHYGYVQPFQEFF